MAIQNFVRVTTADTKKTYEFPGEGNPEIWQVEITIKTLHRISGALDGYPMTSPKNIIHVERETLENAGVVGKRVEPGKKHVPKETAEDLIIRLLEHVECYPCHGDCG